MFFNLKLKKQAIHIMHEYREKYKTAFTKQAKEILDTPNSKSISRTIKENIELQIEICFERKLTFFRKCFRIMGAGSLNETIIQFMTNEKILKINILLIVLFANASLNLIKKDLWFILCYYLKFNNKPIFDYQNIHLRAIWAILEKYGLDRTSQWI